MPSVDGSEWPARPAAFVWFLAVPLAMDRHGRGARKVRAPRTWAWECLAAWLWLWRLRVGGPPYAKHIPGSS